MPHERPVSSLPFLPSCLASALTTGPREEERDTAVLVGSIRGAVGVAEAQLFVKGAKDEVERADEVEDEVARCHAGSEPKEGDGREVEGVAAPEEGATHSQVTFLIEFGPLGDRWDGEGVVAKPGPEVIHAGQAQDADGPCGVEGVEEGGELPQAHQGGREGLNLVDGSGRDALGVGEEGAEGQERLDDVEETIEGALAALTHYACGGGFDGATGEQAVQETEKERGPGNLECVSHLVLFSFDDGWWEFFLDTLLQEWDREGVSGGCMVLLKQSRTRMHVKARWWEDTNALSRRGEELREGLVEIEWSKGLS